MAKVVKTVIDGIIEILANMSETVINYVDEMLKEDELWK